MSLFSSRTADALERIANALERISSPGSSSPAPYKRGLESLTSYGNNNKTWLKENFQTIIQEQGLSPEQSAEILEMALSEYPEEDEENPFSVPL